MYLRLFICFQVIFTGFLFSLTYIPNPNVVNGTPIPFTYEVSSGGNAVSQSDGVGSSGGNAVSQSDGVGSSGGNAVSQSDGGKSMKITNLEPVNPLEGLINFIKGIFHLT